MVHPNALAFREGVTLLFKKWDALKLAVQMEWGGVESKEKRDWMIDVVVEYFGKSNLIYIINILFF
jgi:pre-rRNA-processing protein TSR2